MLLFILYGCALESSTPDFSAKVMRQTKQISMKRKIPICVKKILWYTSEHTKVAETSSVGRP
ncbi:hypothetical protein SBA1_640018 [Candidatus Sulfotelmatobacter kueseliae]|uniref:Uncharacterized protein n=1 Tax=Candidatus Sulfotelmatobacter kueseliae TaxID=2042962 RepID=A0A2U3L2Y8_9BACT|nr:hypothetical protein SBA1_640018 [Candidatus Sulfotelmatobacter kueseliae]